MSKKTNQLNISITPEQAVFIEQVAKHRITGPELVRGLLDAAAEFYKKNGWFSFPVTITPEKFQNPAPTTTQTTPVTRRRAPKSYAA